jgi:hypothetical protein
MVADFCGVIVYFNTAKLLFVIPVCLATAASQKKPPGSPSTEIPVATSYFPHYKRAFSAYMLVKWRARFGYKISFSLLRCLRAKNPYSAHKNKSDETAKSRSH